MGDSSILSRATRPEASVSAGVAGDETYKWKVLASVVVGLFMVILDATVVNVALRALQEKYGVSTSEVQWVISLYTLALGIATPLSGFLGDRLGAKRVFLGGLATFVLGSALCGLAPALPALIAARALQGIGGGIALPLGTAMLFGAFPPRQRGVAFGVFGIVLVFAPASGPLLGGWLVDHHLVPWIFFINLPIGLVGLAIGLCLLRGGPGRPGPVDLAGIVLAPLGFGALLFAASISGDQGAGWGDLRVVGGLAAGLLLLAALVWAELHARSPLLDLRLYGIRTFALGNVVGMIGGVALFGAEFLLPLYLQVLRGRSAFEAGLFLLPLAIASGIVVPLAGHLADRIGPRVPVVIGLLLLTFNTYQLSKITLTTSLAYITFLVVLRGIGIALVVQNAQVAALADVPPGRLTRATPLYSATGQTIQSLGVALLATILSAAVTVTLPRGVGNGGASDLSRLPAAARAAAEAGLHRFQAQYVAGLEHAYLAAFGITILATVLALFLPGWPAAVRRRSAGAPDGDWDDRTSGSDAPVLAS